MTQTIGVTYLWLPYEQAWHLALYYDDGAGNKQVIEAAPQFNIFSPLTFGQVAGETWKELWATTNQNDGSPFGLIVGGVRSWNANNAKDDARPQEILKQADDLSSVWAGLVADANQKFAAGYEYRDLQQNSNTFVATLLTDAGIKLPTGAPIGMAFIPGLQNILHDPI